MWHELLKIPHPSWSELLISGEVFCLLYPLRIIMRFLETEEQQLRRQIIEQHVRNHRTAIKSCHKENCDLLSTADVDTL